MAKFEHSNQTVDLATPEPLNRLLDEKIADGWTYVDRIAVVHRTSLGFGSVNGVSPTNQCNVLFVRPVKQLKTKKSPAEKAVETRKKNAEENA